MTAEQQAAYVMAQAACANARIAGMQTENAIAFVRGVPPPYRKDDFEGVANEFGIHHNAVLTVFGGS